MIEPRGGEDLELLAPRDGAISKAEIQVKGTTGPIGHQELSDCLLHFPERRSEDPLIVRLENDVHRRCIIIHSGRVSDALAPLLAAENWLDGTLARAPISKSACRFILSSLRSQADALPQGTKLKDKRRANAQEYARLLTSSRLEAILDRVHILEQQNHERVKHNCFSLLTREFDVPTSRHSFVLEAAHSAVKEARISGTDVLLKIKDIVVRAGTGRIVPSDAIHRSEEEGWRNQLNKQMALLLTGTPRIGKSYAAKLVAQSYAALGYEIRLFSSVEQAARYLEDPTLDRRLAILDDPLGNGDASALVASEMSKLERLVGSLRAERLLIVAQVSMPLLQLYKKASVSELKTAGLRWVGVDLPSVEFAQQLWKQSCNAHQVNPGLKDFVSSSIASGDLNLEPGSLDYLAAESEKFVSELTIERLIQFSSRSAEQLANTLAGDLQAPLVAALVLASDTSTPAAARELAFALFKGEVELPSLQQGLSYATYTFGGAVDDEEPESPPIYSQDFYLSEDQLRALDLLERRHWIATDHGVNFRHPTFRGAGSFLLDGATSYARKELEQYLRRALFCLPPHTTRAAARNLHWLFNQLENSDAKRVVLDAAIEGLSSKYPATSDLCFEFLSKHTEAWADHSAMIAYGRRTSGEELEDYGWVDGEPYRKLVNRYGSEDIFARLGIVSGDEPSDTLSQLESFHEPLPTVELVVNALSFFSRNPDKINQQHIMRLLSFDVGAVRAPAAAAWLQIPRHDDEEIQRRIFQETHPKVAGEVLSKLLSVWSDIPPARQVELLKGLRNLAQQPSSALVMLSIIEVFDRVSTPSEELAWQVFEELSPVLVSNIPSGISLNDPRLFTIARKAQKYCNVDAYARLLTAMLNRIEADLNKGRLPNDHAFGVAELILNGLPKGHTQKEELLARLLALPGTGARLVVAAELADAWEKLSEKERQQSLDFFSKPSEDQNWLYAAVLTRSKPSAELVRELLGLDVADAITSPSSIQLKQFLSAELFDACLMLYMGAPQPLWWLGKHHGNSQFWQPSLVWIARHPNHSLFDSAWRELADYETVELLSEIVEDLGEPHSQQLFELLLDIKKERVGDFFPIVWESLFRICPDNTTMDRWTSDLAESATSTLDHLSDLSMWIPKVQQNQVIEKLAGDKSLILAGKLISSLEENDDLERVPELFELVDKCIDTSPPKIPGTLSFIRKILDPIEAVPGELLDKIEKLRLALIGDSRTEVPRREGVLVGWRSSV